MAQGEDDPKQRKTLDHVRPMTGAGPGVIGGDRRAVSRARRPGKPGAAPLISWPTFLKQFFKIAGPYWSSERKGKAIFFSVALFFLTVLQVGVPVAINRWMRALFDALEAHEMQQFTQLSGILLVIIISNVLIVNFHLRVKRRLQIDWRDWMNERVWKRLDWHRASITSSPSSRDRTTIPTAASPRTCATPPNTRSIWRMP